MNYCQNKIKKVLIVGLGGVGTVYADIISHNPNVDLRILVDNNRLQQYQNNPRQLNNNICNFKYILPTDKFAPNLIIITTKSSGLINAIKNIAPFVKENTFILSFINGISSENILAKYFPEKQIFHSYIICHTITRHGNNITHDGITKVVWGDKNNNQQKINILKKFFDTTSINNELSENITKSLWEKFCFNCCVNQISAITGYTFKEIWDDKNCLSLIKEISMEINSVAKASGLYDVNLVESTLKNLNKMIPTGKTSMLQDIENNKIPEYELFSAEVIKLAEKLNIEVPQNKTIYKKLINTLKEKRILV